MTWAKSPLETVKPSNTLGRHPRVAWTTSGGKLVTDKDNSVARVTFSDPGTYLVEAKLFLNGEMIRTDSMTIAVRLIP